MQLLSDLVINAEDAYALHCFPGGDDPSPIRMASIFVLPDGETPEPLPMEPPIAFRAIGDAFGRTFWLTTDDIPVNVNVEEPTDGTYAAFRRALRESPEELLSILVNE